MTKKTKTGGALSKETTPAIDEGRSPGVIPGASFPPPPQPPEALAEGEEMEELRKRADELFELHPAAAELHFTADGTAFFMKGNADLHAQNIGNPQIITIKCKEV